MSKNKIIEQIEAAQLKGDVPDFAPGDTLIVQVRVAEGNRERLQAFEGVVLAKRNRQLNSAFTVRKISNGIGVERTFQTYSPVVCINFVDKYKITSIYLFKINTSRRFSDNQ